MQISRLFEIVYLLLDKKCITAQELADRFEVSARTIYRDIDTLSQAGIPVFASRGKGGGIRLMDNFILNKSVLSKEEQSSILSALHGMNALQPGQTGAVLGKLSALFGGRPYDWIEIDFSSWDSSDRISRSLALLKEAIFSRAVISFDYCASDGKTTHRQAEPFALFFVVMTGTCTPGAGRGRITGTSSSAGWTALPWAKSALSAARLLYQKKSAVKIHILRAAG